MTENTTQTIDSSQFATPVEHQPDGAAEVVSHENDVAKKTAALVIGMEVVGLVVDGSLKVASTWLPALEGLAARELIAGGGDLAVISKVDNAHGHQPESVQLNRRQKIASRLGSTALMVGTAYTSARVGLGAAETAGVRNGLQLFGIQVASKAAGLSGMNVVRSRRQQRK